LGLIPPSSNPNHLKFIAPHNEILRRLTIWVNRKTDWLLWMTKPLN